jgi:ferredoxin/mono/diheme cytochrome c family protein
VSRDARHHGEPRLVPALERATFRAEAPVRKVVRSHRLNPLPHAGTISIFLLIVVVVTGVYITLFFGFGFEASHRSVEKMRDHPLQSVVRTVHRYASAALVLTTLVHAWRIFVAGRFRGPRRWRWATGVTSLVIVWLAGVTGYWLVWDERAQALNEATMSLAGGFGTVSSFYVRNVAGPGAGSGWGVMFMLWLVHLLLTVVIGYFLWRHVRRSQLPVMPPRHWMATMLGALVVASLVVPADVLDRVDLARRVGDLPLDPFVLFLLPPLLGGWAWLTIVVLAIVVLAVVLAPFVSRRTATPVVEIDEDACTGCELCVVDCPYLALTMVARSEADVGASPTLGAGRPVAVVDADACVGCGICIGSCSFGAMQLEGFESPEQIDPAGRHVVLACSRHLDAAGRPPFGDDAVGIPVAVVEVACSGMIHANAIGSLMRAGATQVQVIGCAPGDCAYGVGNTILDERLRGDRNPHVPKRWAGVAAEDWVAPGGLVDAVAHPNAHPDVDATQWVPGRRAAGAVAVVLASVVAVAFATRAPYTGGNAGAGVVVIVDHTPGFQLAGQAGPTGTAGDAVEVVTRLDGAETDRTEVPVSGPTAIGVVEVDVAPGDRAVTIALAEGDVETVLFDGIVSLGGAQRLVVSAVDVPPPAGVDEGRDVFTSRLAACDVCHSTEPGDDGVGPSLAGIGDRAAERVPGLDAETYLRRSILDPDAYIVDGYRSGQMLDIYEERLGSEQIDALIEYLMSLRGGAG